MKTDNMTYSKSTQILCVCKTGGPYNLEYVTNLYQAVSRNTTELFSFVCLTDDPEVLAQEEFGTMELKHGWPGWWSKIELFRPDLPQMPSVYFDLDTIVKGNIDRLLQMAHSFPFVALRGFNHRFAAPGKMNFASGVMAGLFGLYHSVYSLFKEDPEKYMTQKQENWMHGDQGFIASVIGVDNAPRLQEFLPDNYIVGKRIIYSNGRIPKESAVIAWSGEPRLHELEGANNPILAHLDYLWKGGAHA